MTHRLLRPAVVAAALALATALAACGGGDSTTTSTATAVGGGVGGVAKCDTASMQEAVATAATAEKTKATLSKDGFRCADGWAVAFADVGPADAQVTETLVFEAEGQFWIPKDRAKVCPKPSDVPASLYRDACETN